MIVRYSFVFNRKKTLNKNGEAVIELVCTLKRARKTISTRLWVKPSQWNNEKKEVRKNHPKCDTYNVRLKELLKRYENFEEDFVFTFRGQDRIFRLNDFNEIGKLEIESNKCFVKFVSAEIKNRVKSGEYQDRTIKGYRSFLGNLEKCMGSIPFNTIDRELAKKIKEWSNGNFKAVGTIWTFEKAMKTFLNAAVEDKLIDFEDVKDVKKILNTQNTVKQDPERLSLDDFRKFRSLVGSNEKQQMCIDAFLIGCYTGLRVSDEQDCNMTVTLK